MKKAKVITWAIVGVLGVASAVSGILLFFKKKKDNDRDDLIAPMPDELDLDYEEDSI